MPLLMCWSMAWALLRIKKIGGYTLFLPQSSVTTDSVQANQIVSTDGNKTWFNTGATGSGMLGNDRTFSWVAPNGNVPAPFKTVSGNMSIYAYINKPENLPLTQHVSLDDSATVEIIYL